MNYGDNRSSRNRGCGARLVVAVMLLILLVSGIRGCMAQIEAEAKAKAVYEATREPTAAERRSEDIRDWMLAVGYDEACIIHSDGSSIVEGSFVRNGETYCVRVDDPTPEPGDDERIAIWMEFLGDRTDEFAYVALAAPTPDTAYDNYVSQEVADHQ